MSDPHRARLQDLFLEAQELSGEERTRFLDARCADDTELRAELEELLSVDQETTGFLEVPAGVEHRSWLDGDGRPGPDAALPERIGEFRVLGVLGEGGMGVVYLAEQDRPRRRVALKVLSALGSGPSMRRRFELEAEVLGRLRHPGIAQIYRAGSAEGRVWFAMELVEGEHVVDAARGLSVRERVELFAQVCDAVHHAHQKGIIHRDIKPANILVDASGQPKVLDFGVARADEAGLARATALTHGGQIVGTVAYMSPEQADAEGEVDVRTDVYALGVVLYQLLADRLPIDVGGLSLATALMRVRTAAPASLAASPVPHARELRGDLETIVAKALEKEPERRYAGAAAFADDLRRYLEQRPIEARPPSALRSLTMFLRRHRVGAALVATVLLSLAVVLAMGARSAERRERDLERTRALLSLVERDLENADPFLNVAVSPADVERLEQAEAWASGALEAYPELVSELRSTLGQVKYRRGDYTGSETLLRAALEPWPEASPDPHPVRLEALTALGLVTADAGRPEEAERCFRRELALRRSTDAPDEAELLRGEHNLALSLKLQQRYAEAEELYRRVLERRETLLGPDHASTLTTCTTLATCLADSRADLDEAVALMRRVHSTYGRNLGADQPETSIAASTLASILVHAGDPRGAEQVLAPAIEPLVQRLGEEHPDADAARFHLAVARLQLGRLEEARDALRDIVRRARERYGARDVRWFEAANIYGQTLSLQGDCVAAIPVWREIVEAGEGLPQLHPGRWTAPYSLAQCLEAQGEPEAAEGQYRHALDVLARTDAPVAEGRTRGALGRLLLAHGDLEQARDQLYGAFELLGAELGEGHDETRTVIDLLVALHDARGEPEEAEGWRLMLR